MFTIAFFCSLTVVLVAMIAGMAYDAHLKAELILAYYKAKAAGADVQPPVFKDSKLTNDD